MTLALGHKSVKECQRWVSSLEFAEWMAYAQLEPFGNDQILSDAHFASLMALTANIAQTKKGTRYKPEDFRLLKLEEEKVEKTETEIYQNIKASLGLK